MGDSLYPYQDIMQYFMLFTASIIRNETTRESGVKNRRGFLSKQYYIEKENQANRPMKSEQQLL